MTGAVPAAGPPAARIEVVEDVYHGVTVSDPYRWLENWEDPRVREWSEQQNAYTRGVLNGLPERAAVHARITEILKAGQSVSYDSLSMAGDGALYSGAAADRCLPLHR